MSDITISVQNLNKIFKVYGHPKNMLKEVILGGVRHNAYHALKDISFEVKRGEVVGVMGRNGAGKSTLLRILAGTLDASSGNVTTRGRISAILELGTGFNPEYTGRENIISGGLVLGMSKEEIREKTDSIIEFSELEDFIDNPFKTYSSGMQARLTFATAISVNPDILIVDEALSVGDAAFQAKCYQRITEMRDAGTSIFLVSHSENTITHFCDRCLLIDKGELLMDAPPREVTMAYCDMVWAKKELTKENAALLQDTETVCENQELNTALTEKELEEILQSPSPLTSEQRQKLKAHRMQQYNLEPFIPNKISRRMGQREHLEIIDMGIFTLNSEKRVKRIIPGEKYICQMTVLHYENINSNVFGFNFRNSQGAFLFGSSTKVSPMRNENSEHCKRGEVINYTMYMTCNFTVEAFFLTATMAYDEKIEDGFYDGLEFSTERPSNIFSDSIVLLNHSFKSKSYL